MSGYRKVPLVSLWMKADRWPWQGFGWRLRGSGNQRFGGGWFFKFGVDVGGSTIIFNLGLGLVRVTWNDPDKLRRELREATANARKRDGFDPKKPFGGDGSVPF